MKKYDLDGNGRVSPNEVVAVSQGGEERRNRPSATSPGNGSTPGNGNGAGNSNGGGNGGGGDGGGGNSNGGGGGNGGKK